MSSMGLHTCTVLTIIRQMIIVRRMSPSKQKLQVGEYDNRQGRIALNTVTINQSGI